MDGFVVILVILAVVGLFAWQFAATKNALATTRVESRHTPHEARAVIMRAFGGAAGALWTDGSGPASINMRRRGKDGGITMSIAIEPLASGGSAVNMWASTYNQYFIFFANFAGAVNSRKKAVARLLAA
jgi:hypothetical protein